MPDNKMCVFFIWEYSISKNYEAQPLTGGQVLVLAGPRADLRPKEGMRIS